MKNRKRAMDSDVLYSGCAFFFRTWHYMPDRVYLCHDDESSRVFIDNVMKRVKCSCGHILFYWIIISSWPSLLFSLSLLMPSHIQRTHKKLIIPRREKDALPTSTPSISSFTSSLFHFVFHGSIKKRKTLYMISEKEGRRERYRGTKRASIHHLSRL